MPPACTASRSCRLAPTRLRFEKETYRPYSRTGIEVAADRTLRLNVELLPEVAGSETVTVVGTPPVVDVGSSTVGTTVGSDFVRNLAVSRPNGLGGANRSFDSLASTAPNAANDVYGVAISGSQSPENSYLIDGLSVNDPAYGVNGSPLTVEFIDEVNVITGGYMPEYGRTLGGALSATTKSGGNEFHGTVFGTWTPGGLTGPAGPLTIAGGTPVILTSRDLELGLRPRRDAGRLHHQGQALVLRRSPVRVAEILLQPRPTRRPRSTPRVSSSPTR